MAPLKDKWTIKPFYNALKAKSQTSNMLEKKFFTNAFALCYSF